MIRGTYLAAAAVALLWFSGVMVLFVMFDDWFFSQASTLLVAFALLVCPLWGIAALARLMDTQSANELAVKDMQKLMISIERQIYERVTQSTFLKQASEGDMQAGATPAHRSVTYPPKKPVQNVQKPVHQEPPTSQHPPVEDIRTHETVEAGPTKEPILPEMAHVSVNENMPDAVREEAKETVSPNDQVIPTTKAKEGVVSETPPKSIPENEIPEFSWMHFVQAADFPQDMEDPENVAAVKSTLRDSLGSDFLRAAEDLLAWFAENNLFMEDYQPEIPSLENWKNMPLDLSFDKPTLTASRSISKFLQNDVTFRELSSGFMDTFDKVLSKIFDETDGQEILCLADTRSGRAYLLLTRAKQITDNSIEKSRSEAS